MRHLQTKKCTHVHPPKIHGGCKQTINKMHLQNKTCAPAKESKNKNKYINMSTRRKNTRSTKPTNSSDRAITTAGGGHGSPWRPVEVVVVPAVPRSAAARTACRRPSRATSPAARRATRRRRSCRRAAAAVRTPFWRQAAPLPEPTGGEKGVLRADAPLAPARARGVRLNR